MFAHAQQREVHWRESCTKQRCGRPLCTNRPVPTDSVSSQNSPLVLGTSRPLPPQLVEELTTHQVIVREIVEHGDPPADVDVVLVLQPPSPLLGRCRGRWPVIVAVDDPRATDVSRLLRAGATDVVRHPLQAADLVSRIRRAAVEPRTGA